MAEASTIWPSIFPQTISTRIQSLKFLTKLFQVGVSSVAYLRFNFPEEAFEEHEIEGMKVKLLIGGHGCTSARALVNIMASAAAALKKGYLAEFMLYVFENDPDEIYEMYKFCFPKPSETPMNPGKKVEKLKDIIELKEATKALLKKLLISTQELGFLPEIAHMGVRITIHEDIAPKEYSIPRFIDCTPHQACRFWSTGRELQATQTKMLSTNWHRYQCVVISASVDNNSMRTPSQSQESAVSASGYH